MIYTLLKHSHALSIALLLSLNASFATAMEMVTLGANRDASIYSENDVWANGSGDHLFAGRIANNTANRRAMIYFDIAAALPPGATIQSAALQLLLNNKPFGGGAEPFSIHALSSDWQEGPTHPLGQEGIGALGTLGDSTWLYNSFSNTTWTVAGGDFNPIASAMLLSGDLSSTNTFNSAQTVTDVQNWLDHPSQNFGWMLIGDESSAGSARRFGSRENGFDPGPQLVITYQIPEANTGLLLLIGLGLLYKNKKSR